MSSHPGSTVTLTLDGLVAGTTTADAAGAWSFAIAPALADGQHSATATASDAGGTSPASPVVSFTIDTRPDTPDDPTPPADGCGCGAGSGDASWMLAGLALLAGITSRRRRMLA
jgi:MYXO-CTERM domain-containing protein